MPELGKFYRNDLSNLFLLYLQIAGGDAEKRGSKNFEEVYKERLKFKNITDWKKFRACIDLFEDTEYAIISVFKFQLGDLRSKNRDFGEVNLRLYGILNAVYLQINSIVELAKMLHYPNPKETERYLKSLDIYMLRGIAGSHTVNFQLGQSDLTNNLKSRRSTSFRIVQAYLGKTGERIVAMDEDNNQFEFDLLKILNEYKEITTEFLIKLMTHSIESLLRKEKDKISFKERLDEVVLNLIYNTPHWLDQRIGLLS